MVVLLTVSLLCSAGDVRLAGDSAPGAARLTSDQVREELAAVRVGKPAGLLYLLPAALILGGTTMMVLGGMFGLFTGLLSVVSLAVAGVVAAVLGLAIVVYLSMTRWKADERAKELEALIEDSQRASPGAPAPVKLALTLAVL